MNIQAKQKAEELLDKYLDITPVDYSLNDTPAQVNEKAVADFKLAKQCALIAVNLHLDELSKMKLIFSDREIHYKHWEQVKKELESYE